MNMSATNEALADGTPAAAPPPQGSLRSRILSGSLTLLIGSGLVGVANLVYNVAIARMLGPAEFGQATAVYTLLMLMSAVTLSFQIVCTKLVANHPMATEKAAVYSGLHRKAWVFGIAIALLMILSKGVIATYLNLPDPFLIVLLALGTMFYVPLGARRGCIQGTCAFHLLAINLIVEGLVRLGGAFLLIKLGMGVTGAVLASVAAVIIAYLFASPGPGLVFVRGLTVPTSFREGLQAIVFFAGQVIINNFDIVLVKHFFASEEAGLYAAVALVGRFVNMCAWSVVSSMFPVSAAARSEGRGSKSVLPMSLLLVCLVVGCIIFVLWAVPGFFWRVIFGAQFELSGYGEIANLLILYAVTTGVYSLTAVVIAYEMSRKIANTGWIQLAFSGMLVLGMSWFHSSLREVILVQLVLMIMLLVVVMVPVLTSAAGPREERELPAGGGEVHKRRALSQHEVIAEFLKNEFHHPEFDDYRARFEHLVTRPDMNDSNENGLRRALLFLRRGPMWRELPNDTQWWEVELTRHDLSRIRVFPRAQWRRMARGNFYLTEIADRMREALNADSNDEFFSKLRRLGQAEILNTTVLLIGVDERQPLTILDGNHRVAAGMVAVPSSVPARFRFICGFSPRMTECCWYETNLNTLWRYAKNLLRHIAYRPEADIQSFLNNDI